MLWTRTETPYRSTSKARRPVSYRKWTNYSLLAGIHQMHLLNKVNRSRSHSKLLQGLLSMRRRLKRNGVRLGYSRMLWEVAVVYDPVLNISSTFWIPLPLFELAGSTYLSLFCASCDPSVISGVEVRICASISCKFNETHLRSLSAAA